MQAKPVHTLDKRDLFWAVKTLGKSISGRATWLEELKWGKEQNVWLRQKKSTSRFAQAISQKEIFFPSIKYRGCFISQIGVCIYPAVTSSLFNKSHL